MFDANEAYDPITAVKFADLVSDTDLEWFEEPCASRDDIANRYVKDFHAHDDAQVGSVIEFAPFNPQRNDMVLCRYNAPLVSAFYDLISQGKKMQWSIWKTLPGDPLTEDSKPADYMIFNSYESQEQYDASQDVDYVAIAQKVHGISNKKAQKMIDSSFDPREATRSYTLSIQAQAAAADFNPTPGLVCSISLMQEKNDDYESFEKEVFKGQFQKAVDIGAQTFWGFTRVEERSENACCLLYTSPSPRDKRQSRMPSSA